MLLPVLATLAGLVLLVWSADRFVEGAAALAVRYSVPPLLIGMVIIGFGTSVPEMMVSAFAAAEGSTGLALGNAYGSNIANIALILGVTALIRPIAVQSTVVRKEIPILLGITVLTVALLFDGRLGRTDAFILLAAFFGLMAWSLFEAIGDREDTLGQETEAQLAAKENSAGRALFWIVAGLALLIGGSRLLVWGAVEIAAGFGVSDLIIGLTVVAVGTSLPEFATSVSAALRGQSDLAIGNVLGSNLFNTLVVVGIAGTISPTTVPPEILSRDLLAVGVATGALFLFCYGFRGPGVLNRYEGALLVAGYLGYTAWLIG